MRKLSKKLLLSILSVALVFIALGTTTFAWFSMNTEVKASNMYVKAKAENGLLINEVSTANDQHWDEEASANQAANSAALLYPASTADGSTWYHAASKKSANSASATSDTVSPNLVGGAYETLSSLTSITAQAATAVAGTTAARTVMGETATSTAGYYVHYIYYLKSSGEEIDLGTDNGDLNVQIKSVVATVTGTNSTNLNKAVRVGIKLNSAFYIYAPLTGYTATYYVAAGTTATQPKASNVVTNTDLATLPASNAAGAQVDVFIWFEGEDANCISDNALAAELDNIKIDITFALKEVATN